MSRFILNTILTLSKTLFRFAPRDGLLTFGLMLFRSLTAGCGLLLIIPLLHVIGIHLLGHESDRLNQYITTLLTKLHLPLTLSSVLLLFVVIMTSIASAYFAEEIIRTRWQERYQYHLRKTIYQSILNTTWSFFLNNNSSELLHGITAQLQAAWQCHFQLLQLFSQCILISVYVVLSSMVSWQMTGIATIIAIGFLGLMRPLHRLTVARSHDFLKHNKRLFQAFYEQLSALKIIKSCNKEACFLEKITEQSSFLQQQQQYFIKVKATSKWVYSVGTALSFAILLYLAIHVFTLPIGSLVLLLLVFSRLMPMVSSTQQSYQQLLRQLPAYASLQDLLRESLAHQEVTILPSDGTTMHFQEAIAFHHVSFAYHPGLSPPVIQQFSMRLQKNTTTTLVGLSGAGKTTIADLLVGLLTPTTGHITIDQQPLDQHNLISWRNHVAYIPQDNVLFNGSVRENLLLFAPSVTEEEIWEALRSVSATDFVNKLDQRLDTQIGERGIRLSGGERQRLALARALLMKPQLLIIDESTNALDEQNIKIIQQSLKTLHGKMTILIIAHQGMMHHVADQVVTLQNSDQDSYKYVEKAITTP
ncbi:MAG: ABC transporter ATP-binding protein/permease [Gammaproteobacteria bacterium]|nr:ABC transporter ATP-binding protein/permease [Gammaproteobacteria bacterium]